MPAFVSMRKKKEDWFREHCDYVLINDCASAEEFQAKARALFEEILNP